MWDVLYRDLVADGEQTVRRVCERAELDFDAAAVRGWLERRPQHHAGRHTYSLEEHGLDEGMVRERFAAYVEAFDV